MLKECKRRARGPISGLHDKSVISEVHARGKGRLYIGMFTQLMTDMSKQGPGDTELPDFFYCLSQREMGDMLFMAEGIENDLPAALDLFSFAFVDAIGIGDIGKVTKPKAQHGHFHVPDLD